MPSFVLVIDTSVARSAGGPDATHPDAKRCRDLFTALIEDTSHRLVLTPDLRTEWREHQSTMARGWLRDMIASDRVVALADVRSVSLRQAIEAYAPQDGVRDLMIKDAMLVEAALKTDVRIIALDDQVRGHFSRAAGEIDMLRAILWSNPRIPGETCIEWVRNGARREMSRLLYRFRQ